MSDFDNDLANKSVTLLNRLLADPSTAVEAEKLIEKINPSADFPMRRAREAVLAPVMSELEKERARVAALEEKWASREKADAEATQRRAEDEMLSRIEKVKARRGFSDDMMATVLQRMRDQNNPDVEAAAAWVAESVPKKAPAAGHDFLPSNVDPLGLSTHTDFYEGLMDTGPQGADRWLDKTLRGIVRDPEFARMGGG